ncbi:MAG TPA: hypothetical protein VM925_21895 [Labilithrix sp.]|nr:hypothetical protein [Labilithrix sp.]
MHLKSRLSAERLAVVALAFGATAAFACGDSSATALDSGAVGSEAGSPDAERTDASSAAFDAGATCELPSSFGSKKCNECVAESCCASVSDCTSDPLCKPLVECILGCIDEPDAGGCVDECKVQHPDPNAHAKWDTIETCSYFSDPCAFHCSTQY